VHHRRRHRALPRAAAATEFFTTAARNLQLAGTGPWARPGPGPPEAGRTRCSGYLLLTLRFTDSVVLPSVMSELSLATS
jgi:hypothetical protein